MAKTARIPDPVCLHTVTYPVSCPGCSRPNSPARFDECPLCGGDREIEQCGHCAVWPELVAA